MPSIPTSTSNVAVTNTLDSAVTDIPDVTGEAPLDAAAERTVAPSLTKSLLRIDGLEAGYESELILRGITVDIAPGDCVAITGANGCGKSTLLKTIVGALPIRGGSVQIGDWVRTAQKPGTAANTAEAKWDLFGYVPQKKHSGGGIGASVREVVASGLLGQGRLFQRGRNWRAKVDQALQAVDAADLAKTQYNTLSGGQMQRVLIARALIRQPRLWLLDEPLTGLDQHSRQTLARLVAQQIQAGATALIVLHEIGEFAGIVNRELHLEGGQVAFWGRPENCPLPKERAWCDEEHR